MQGLNLTTADRREFLRACGRWGALLVLTSGGVALFRSGRVRARSAACWEPHPCGGCGLAALCDLPAARAAEGLLTPGGAA